MTEKKTCYNCGNKNCHIFYSTVKQDVAEHHETYEYTELDCVNHNKWEELKVEEIRTDNTETLINALERITELEKENAELKKQVKQKQHLADVRLEQSLENYNLFANERKERIDIDIALEDMKDNLTKAKEIIEELYNIIPASMADYAKEPMEHARKFMTEE